MIREEQLLEQREIREQLVGRVEVLEKVKELLLIPQTDIATVKQVAEFYEVGKEAIEAIYTRHKDELTEDGMHNKSYKDFLNLQHESLETVKGKATFTYISGEKLNVPMRGLKVFPRRAILRIGMLLRDSSVAKEVRTQLLNIEEKTSNEIKVQDINEEQKLQLEIGMAYGSGNPDTIMLTTAKYMDFKNRHIKLQEQHIEKLKQDNKALTGEILTWKDRNKMSYAVRRLATMLHKPFGTVWNDLYKNLYYQYSISVKARGGTPYVQHIKENEWDKVIKTFSAMCEQNNISPSEILNDANKYDGGIN